MSFPGGAVPNGVDPAKNPSIRWGASHSRSEMENFMRTPSTVTVTRKVLVGFQHSRTLKCGVDPAGQRSEQVLPQSG